VYHRLVCKSKENMKFLEAIFIENGEGKIFECDDLMDLFFGHKFGNLMYLP